jgi:hypothetical protein
MAFLTSISENPGFFFEECRDDLDDDPESLEPDLLLLCFESMESLKESGDLDLDEFKELELEDLSE